MRRRSKAGERHTSIFNGFLEHLKEVAAREDVKLTKALTQSEQIRQLFNSVASITIPMISEKGTYIERR